MCLCKTAVPQFLKSPLVCKQWRLSLNYVLLMFTHGLQVITLGKEEFEKMSLSEESDHADGDAKCRNFRIDRRYL